MYSFAIFAFSGLFQAQAGHVLVKNDLPDMSIGSHVTVGAPSE